MKLFSFFILKGTRIAFPQRAQSTLWANVFLTALQMMPGFSCCASPFAFNLFSVSSLRKKSSLFPFLAPLCFASCHQSQETLH